MAKKHRAGYEGSPTGETQAAPTQEALQALADTQTDIAVAENPPLEPLVPVEVQSAAPLPDAASGEDSMLSRLVAEAKADPNAANELLNIFASTPEGRSVLGIQPGQGPAMGEWNRNYDDEPQIRVTGGVEVRHGANFEGRPPSYIKLYMGEGGKMVDEVRLALKDASGKPVKTERYKEWIDVRLAGGRFDSNVRHDILQEHNGQQVTVGADTAVFDPQDIGVS